MLSLSIVYVLQEHQLHPGTVAGRFLIVFFSLYDMYKRTTLDNDKVVDWIFETRSLNLMNHYKTLTINK